VREARHKRLDRMRWRRVRREVLDRDGWACIECGGDRRLSVHHIEEDGPDFESSNLKTLCSACHLLHHRPWQSRADRTHCEHGHVFTPENTYVNPSGWRSCRECRRQSLRRLYQRRKEALCAS